MYYISVLSLFHFSLLTEARAIERPKSTRPVHTYSIVARDPRTGEMGVAVQSHWFAIGSLVPWGKAGVGVVATQSFIDTRYGTSGIKLMEEGWSAKQALQAIRAADPHPEIRQVAMLDFKGNVATHSGKSCIKFAGYRSGENYSVQSNLMIKEGVPEVMERAFLESKGPLAERLLKALEAAQAAGGDLRGKQSAAILVVAGQPSQSQSTSGRLVDLHVEDNSDPILELRRLYTLHKAYEHMNQGDLAIEEKKIDEALNHYGKAEKMFPENLEMKFWHAVSLVNAKRVAESLPLFRVIFSKDKNWSTLIPRLSEVKIIPDEKGITDEILSVSPKNDHK
ncbi:MAG: DUF1028 domain-containing protein [Bdellovibrionales bacterium]|nr:DUF1028 domain-containing protein [Bdellovibrionales bacterium]